MKQPTLFSLATFLALSVSGEANANEPFQELFHIEVSSTDEWRPPFGLARIDGPVTVTVACTRESLPARSFHLDGFRVGKAVEGHVIQFPKHGPMVVKKQLKRWPDEVTLRPAGSPVRKEALIRQVIQPPAFEVDAIARPEKRINPVDLGEILFPENRLLLGPDQGATVEVAGINRERDIPNGRIQVYFESDPSDAISKVFELKRDQRMTGVLAVPARRIPRDALRIVLLGADNQELWSKRIQTRAIQSPPKLPAFGATKLKLNYELPIAVFKEGPRRRPYETEI